MHIPSGIFWRCKINEILTISFYAWFSVWSFLFGFIQKFATFFASVCETRLRLCVYEPVLSDLVKDAQCGLSPNWWMRVFTSSRKWSRFCRLRRTCVGLTCGLATTSLSCLPASRSGAWRTQTWPSSHPLCWQETAPSSTYSPTKSHTRGLETWVRILVHPLWSDNPKLLISTFEQPAFSIFKSFLSVALILWHSFSTVCRYRVWFERARSFKKWIFL